MTGSPANPTTPLMTVSATDAAAAMASEPASSSTVAGQPLGQGGSPRGVGNGHNVRAEALCLLSQEIHRAGRTQGGHPVLVGSGLDDVERLGSDRSGRAENGNR